METPRDPHTSELTPSPAHPGPKSPIIPLRYLIISLLFFVTTINNADRATLNAAGPGLSKDLGLDPAALGIVLSAFGWSYVIAQLPAGWLLDRLGSYRVYTWCILLWSFFTLLQGFVGYFNAGTAIVILFVLRLLVGFAEAPSFPANGRIVASWFPTKERGTASAIFNSAQYFATVIFAPLMGSIIYYFGWRDVFWVMGGLGLAIILPWRNIVRPPKDHPRMTAGELAFIEKGGALISMDQRRDAKTAAAPFRWSAVRELLASRMMIGVYFGQYCIATITAFFLTWFFSYLVKERQMTIFNAGFVAMLPALCGFGGGVLGGVFSDFLLRKGYSLTFARKFPIVAGMLLSCIIVTCNYVDTNWLVVLFMSLAFFGKGIGALGWTVVSDTSPKQVMGVCGALFNMFGNISTITTPIAIGYIIKYTGGFNGALVFVGAHAVGAILSYLLIVGEIKRLELSPEPPGFPVVLSK
jgi:MFS transporter, ACS family, glucarate transporter